MQKIQSILSVNLLSGSTGSAKIASQINDAISHSSAKMFSLVGYQKNLQQNTKSIYSYPPMGFRYYFWVALNFFFDIFTPKNLSYEKLKKYEEYQKSDILHFHTIQGGYFDYRDLPKISKEKKIIWTLHDDWFCSGNDKDGSLFPYKPLRSFKKRNEILQQSDIHVVAVSNWMYQKALSSNIFHKDHIHLIHNGIDTSIFYPRGKKESRKILGIREDITMVVSIAGAGRKSRAKGVNYVEQLAIELSSDSSIEFFTLGNAKTSIQGNIHQIGFISSDMMALYFSAADIFLYPTRADSFGLVIAESIACGCPVITFEVGATSELVQDGKTGYLVSAGDYEGLKKAFFDFKTSPLKVDLSSLGFDISSKRMVQEYMNLYDSLVGQ
ncbi:glycosyltransferase [Candidatus Gracilibacteria bacterium]|nr:glycosyltransferase [Candidatus Gracilibacteria bacterium]